MASTGANLHLPPQGIELRVLEREADSLVTIRLSIETAIFFPLRPATFRNAGLASDLAVPLSSPSLTNHFSLIILQIDAVKF